MYSSYDYKPVVYNNEPSLIQCECERCVIYGPGVYLPPEPTVYQSFQWNVNAPPFIPANITTVEDHQITEFTIEDKASIPSSVLTVRNKSRRKPRKKPTITPIIAPKPIRPISIHILTNLENIEQKLMHAADLEQQQINRRHKKRLLQRQARIHKKQVADKEAKYQAIKKIGNFIRRQNRKLKLIQLRIAWVCLKANVKRNKEASMSIIRKTLRDWIHRRRLNCLNRDIYTHQCNLNFLHKSLWFCWQLSKDVLTYISSTNEGTPHYNSIKNFFSLVLTLRRNILLVECPDSLENYIIAVAACNKHNNQFNIRGDNDVKIPTHVEPILPLLVEINNLLLRLFMLSLTEFLGVSAAYVQHLGNNNSNLISRISRKLYDKKDTITIPKTDVDAWLHKYKLPAFLIRLNYNKIRRGVLYWLFDPKKDVDINVTLIEYTKDTKYHH